LPRLSWPRWPDDPSRSSRKQRRPSGAAPDQLSTPGYPFRGRGPRGSIQPDHRGSWRLSWLLHWQYRCLRRAAPCQSPERLVFGQGFIVPMGDQCLRIWRYCAKLVTLAWATLYGMSYRMADQVLSVDDDPTQRRLLEATVSKLGFTPVTADSGDGALKL